MYTAAYAAYKRWYLESKTLDPLECPRVQTVSVLWERIQEHHVVHVRATPASGKSTLSRLLEQHVKRKHPDLPVKWCSWPMDLLKRLGYSNYNNHNKVLHTVFNIPLNLQIDWLNWPALFIIDEAQASYSCITFWNDFIKAISKQHAPMVILFSSWGSAAGRSEAKTPTPIYFDPNQRISIRPPQDSESRVSVFFTRAEFDDVVHRVMVYESQHGQAFSPNGDVVDYIWNLTNGHPHATRMISRMLATSDVSISTDTYEILTLICVCRYRRSAHSVKTALSFHWMRP